jgi:hypothetical protein
MPILCRAVFDRQIMSDLGQLDVFQNEIFNNKTTFDHLSNPEDREFLIDSVSSGYLSSQPSVHDQIIFEDNQITLVTEWLDQSRAQAWCTLRLNRGFPGLTSCTVTTD